MPQNYASNRKVIQKAITLQGDSPKNCYCVMVAKAIVEEKEEDLENDCPFHLEQLLFMQENQKEL